MSAPTNGVVDSSGAQVAPKGQSMRSVAANDKATNGARVSVLKAKPREWEFGDHPEMATALLRALPSDAPPVCDLGAIHTYAENVGVWSRIDKSAASKIVQRFSGGIIVGLQRPKPLTLRKTDVYGTIDLAQDQAKADEFFDKDVPGVAFVNGFARLGKAIEVMPHSPEHRARFAYGFAFDEKASREKWTACLSDAFRGDYDAVQKIACLQEFAGAALFGIAPKYQRAIIQFGTGDNAKSTLANVIQAAMPKGSTCAIAPQTWGNEYRLALLAGKLLNVVNELPESEILASESFKATITGDMMTARQIRETPFDFKAKAGHLFSANRLPGTNDQTKGFWRRLIVLVYNRTFADSEKDADLADKIIASELPGVVSWMIEGARRLLAQGHYTIPPSSERAIAMWRRSSDPVAIFVEERTVPVASTAARTQARDMFEAFTRWAEQNKFKPMNSQTFGRRMTGLGHESDHTNKGEMYSLALKKMVENEEDFTGFGRGGVGGAPVEDAENWDR